MHSSYVSSGDFNSMSGCSFDDISSQLHSDRDSIPDVPAIYFCAPTEENLGRIAQDFQNGLYDVYHLNFISPISRQKLEDLAAAALQSSCVANIHKVYDQYLNFITLEDDMFILKHQNSDAMSYYGETLSHNQQWFTLF